MSSFFEPPPPPPAPAAEHPQPPWAGPGDDEIGRAVALNLMLGRSDKAALWIPAATVNANGFECEFELRYRFDAEDFVSEHWHPFHPPLEPTMRRQRRSEEGLSPSLLRWGIQFSDGRKATNVGRRGFPAPDESPEGPVLWPRGGRGGGGDAWQQSYWVWPLPPEGPLAFVCAWPIADMPETRSEIDSALLRDAAADASASGLRTRATLLTVVARLRATCSASS
jgi:hypothetical protein